MILDKIVADKQIRLVEHKSCISPAKMRELAKAARHIRPVFMKTLQNRGFLLSGNSKKHPRALETSSVRLI